MQNTKHPILIRYLQDLKKGNGPNTANILGTINNVAVIDTADAVNIITPTRLKTWTVQNTNIVQLHTVVIDAFKTETPTLLIACTTRFFLSTKWFEEEADLGKHQEQDDRRHAQGCQQWQDAARKEQQAF